MKRIIIIFIALCFFSVNTCSGEELNPPEIMDKYGEAVVLTATVKSNNEMGLGSGFIVTEGGVIITNYHVIEGAYPAIVKLKNGDIYEEISVIDYSERKDIAVIKIKGFDLPLVELGNSNEVRIGEEIVVIGNPQGLENTISNGLLSQIRDTEGGYKLHQISAPISPGSSGGPVFNLNGEVIGIATLTCVEEYSQNLNFSVPINYARAMMNGPVKQTLEEFSKGEGREVAKKSKEDDLTNFLNDFRDCFNIYITACNLLDEGRRKTKRKYEWVYNEYCAEEIFIGYEVSSDIKLSREMFAKALDDAININEFDTKTEKVKKSLIRALELQVNATSFIDEGYRMNSKNYLKEGKAKCKVADSYVLDALKETLKIVPESHKQMRKKMDKNIQYFSR